MQNLTHKEVELIKLLDAHTLASQKHRTAKSALMYVIDFITYHLVPTSMMLIVVWLSRGFLIESTMFMLELVAVFAPVFAFSIHRMDIVRREGCSRALMLPFLMGFLVDSTSRKLVRQYAATIKGECLSEIKALVAINEALPNIDQEVASSLVNAAAIGDVSNVSLYEIVKKRPN